MPGGPWLGYSNTLWVFFFSKTILSFMLYHQTLLPVIQFMDKEKEIIIQYFFLEKFSPYLEFHNKSLFLAQWQKHFQKKKIGKSFTKELFSIFKDLIMCNIVTPSREKITILYYTILLEKLVELDQAQAGWNWHWDFNFWVTN